ncbi:MAG: pitrilysin family protein [Planctomycetota bacterium]
MSARKKSGAAAARRAALAVPDLAVRRFELPCGAGVVVSPRAGAPVFSAEVHVRGGHSLDPAGREGTAYLSGGLLDQGTERRDEQEIVGLLEPAGGQISGSAWGLTGSIAGADWKLLLDLLCEMTISPTYPKDRVDLHRGRLLDRLRVESDDPRTRAVWLFRQLVYGAHWLGRPEYGELESVERIRRSHLASFHKKNWCGVRTLVTTCGDVDPEEVRRHLRRRLSGWKRGVDLDLIPWEEPAASSRVGAYFADRQQVHVYLGHLGVRRSDPDYPALVVLDHILGTGPGFTSRITRKLRDELGLAYSVSAAITPSASVFPGTFTAYIGTSPEHVETAIQGFLAEIHRIRDELVSPDELELARGYLLGSFALGFERASRRTRYLVYAERNRLPDRHLDELLAAFAEVTAEDVQRAAQKHLLPERCCVAAAGPIREEELERIVQRALVKPRPKSRRTARR